MARSGCSDVEAGFAKLQGEDFEYYMQTYSIVLGRNSTTSTVDVDLSSLDGGKNISRHHARIYFDFERRRFALDVLGRNGCHVEGVQHLPGNPPVKLDSQDLLQIGGREFYFLLPDRNILLGALAPRHRHGGYAASKKGETREYSEEEAVAVGRAAPGGGRTGKKKIRRVGNSVAGSSARLQRRRRMEDLTTISLCSCISCGYCAF